MAIVPHQMALSVAIHRSGGLHPPGGSFFANMMKISHFNFRGFFSFPGGGLKRFSYDNGIEETHVASELFMRFQKHVEPNFPSDEKKYFPSALDVQAR